jgi:chromosome segregation ATPase
VIISKEVEKRRVKVFLSGILFLEKRYNDFFQISIEDKKEIEKILSNVRDYSYKREDVVDFLESEMEEVKEILDRLNSLIERLALKLREREVLTYEEIRREFDEIF